MVSNCFSWFCSLCVATASSERFISSSHQICLIRVIARQGFKLKSALLLEYSLWTPTVIPVCSAPSFRCRPSFNARSLSLAVINHILPFPAHWHLIYPGSLCARSKFALLPFDPCAGSSPRSTAVLLVHGLSALHGFNVHYFLFDLAAPTPLVDACYARVKGPQTFTVRPHSCNNINIQTCAVFLRSQRSHGLTWPDRLSYWSCWSEKHPFICYILFNKTSIALFFTSNNQGLKMEFYWQKVFWQIDTETNKIRLIRLIKLWRISQHFSKMWRGSF